jgi:hypothetical protein
MYPSKGYTKINDNPPTTLEDLESEFLSILQRIVKVEGEVKCELNVRPCFKRLIEKAELTHHQRVALVNELQYQNYSIEQVKEIFHKHKAWETKYDREKTDKQIESVYGKYGWFTKEKLKLRGICFEGCPLEDFEDCRQLDRAKKVSFRSCGNSTFEQALGPNGENGFAVFVEMDNEVKFQTAFEDPEEKREYHPLEMALWPLAKFPNNESRISSVLDAKGLFEEVRNYIYAYVELPHETLYDIVALWVMASYLPEKFESIPYLAFIGPRDSGKTRALECLWQLSYRAVLSPSFSSSALFRTIQKYGPTLCLDEAEIYGSEQKNEAIAVLNAGYRKGQYVIRVNADLGGIDCFSVFGFKALASTNVFVPSLESRAIIVNMRRNVRDIPLFLDLEKASNLRLMLLVYRFNVLRGKLSVLDREKVLGYLPTTHGRIAELFYPLIAVSPSEEIRQKVSEYARQVYVRRLEEERATVEAEMVQVLLNLADRVEGGKLTIEAITEAFNQGKPEKQQWRPESIGRLLKRLGFSKTRIGKKGQTAINYEKDLVDYLSKRYGLAPSEKPSEPSVPSVGMEHYVHGKAEGSESSEGSFKGVGLDDLASVYWKEEPLREKECGVCGYVRPTVWEAVTTKGQVIAICEDCVREYQKRRENV